MPKSMVEVERKDTQMCTGTAAHKHYFLLFYVACSDTVNHTVLR